jgi:SAM-dependent methyltransferase
MDIQYAGGRVEKSFEDTHWWMKSRLRLIDRILRQLSKPSISVLEIGCGTGINLRYLEINPVKKITYLLGVDPSAPRMSTGSIRMQPELPEGQQFDLILVMDVLEHTDTPIELLRRIRQALLPDGLILITVPAFQSLWTDYDHLAHHKKRYSLRDLRSEVQTAGFKVRDSYFLFGSLFPFFLLQRLWIKFRKPADVRLFKPTPGWLNGLFYRITAVEIMTWMPMNRWFGSSIVALASNP